MARRFFPTLDYRVWRIVGRGVPQHLSPLVDGRDCYVFQRRVGPNRRDFETHVMPVAKFWGVGPAFGPGGRIA